MGNASAPTARAGEPQARLGCWRWFAIAIVSSVAFAVQLGFGWNPMSGDSAVSEAETKEAPEHGIVLSDNAKVPPREGSDDRKNDV